MKDVTLIIDEDMPSNELVKVTPASYKVIEDPLFDYLDMKKPYPYAALFTINTTNKDCLLVSPVHIQTSHNDAVITAYGRKLLITADEYQAITDMLTTFFDEYNLDLLVSSSHKWILAGRDITMKTAPVFDAYKKSLSMMLFSGTDSAFFLKLFTEIQMLLHEHPINIQRRKNGLLEINALWLWGEGILPIINKNIIAMTDSPSLIKWGVKSKVEFLSCIEIDEFISRIKKQKQPGLIFIRKLNSELLALYDELKKHTRTHWYWRDGSYSIKKESRWWF